MNEKIKIVVFDNIFLFQDYIVSIKEDFINLLVDNETYLYICGDAQNMQKEVVLTIKSCLQSVKGNLKYKILNLDIYFFYHYDEPVHGVFELS